MNISAINNTTNFKGIYAVASNSKTDKQLEDAFGTNRFIKAPVNDVPFYTHKQYKKWTSARDTGKNLYIVITGDDYRKAMLKETPLHTIDSICFQARETFFDLTKNFEKAKRVIIDSLS